MTKDRKLRASGCLFGLALGDALAVPTEFLRSVYEIRDRFGSQGPAEPDGEPARVTDDTQMTLAVGEALVAAPRPYAPAALEEPLRQAFIAWMVSPDNTRAPGMTCSIACLAGAFAGAYHDMMTWPEEWARRIEYRDRMAALGQVWD